MPGRRLSNEIHAKIASLSEEHYSTREIAKRLRLKQSTVSRSLKKLKAYGKFSYPKPKGRKRCTSIKTDSAIIRVSKRNPFLSATSIKIEWDECHQIQGPSVSTIKRRLSEVGLKAYKPAKKPFLSTKNIKDRISFCEKYKNWSESDWS